MAPTDPRLLDVGGPDPLRIQVTIESERVRDAMSERGLPARRFPCHQSGLPSVDGLRQIGTFLLVTQVSQRVLTVRNNVGSGHVLQAGRERISS